MIRIACLVVALAGCGRLGFEPGVAGDAADAPGDGTSGPGSLAFVQASPFQEVMGVGAAVVSFPQTLAAGHLVLVYAWSWGQNGTGFAAGAVTDDRGTTYMPAVTLATAPGACSTGTGAIGIYYATGIAAGASPTITVAPSGPANQEIEVIAVEYAGLSVASPFDQQTSNVATGASPLTFTTGTTLPTSTEAELLASVALACPGYPDPIVWSELHGFTPRAVQSDTVTHEPGMAADKFVATSGSYQDAWTITYTGGAYPVLGAVATFR